MSAALGGAPALPAAGSSFYLGMRILPKERREAMYAIYAFCRAVDDVADGSEPRPIRAASLEGWRHDIDALFAGQPAGRAAFLKPSVDRFELRRASFHEIIDGMASDVEADFRAPDWASLDLYCDRVASAVGRLSCQIFGLPQPEGDRLAHHLGRALQLTNILRDLDEDCAIGRLYLPGKRFWRPAWSTLRRSPSSPIPGSTRLAARWPGRPSSITRPPATS
jgi:phytoene synthase